MAPTSSSFPIGTRKSKLAMIQAEQFQGLLQTLHPNLTFPIIGISAQGDINQTTPLHQFSSNAAKGLWTEELEVLLAEKKCRMVVNCLKDLPTTLPDGFKIAIVGEREDPRDAVVMATHCHAKTLAELPPGSVVGTSSIRRSAQIKRAFPELQFADMRGNVGTRLSKLDDPSLGYACLILAAAGLSRLDLLDRVTQYLEGPVMYQSPGQGALAIEVLEGDDETETLLRPLDHFESRMCTWAERGMMRYLQGGCSVPIGCETKYEDGLLTLTGIVVSVDGQTAVDATISAPVKTDAEATQLGEQVAQKMVDGGAKAVLDEIERTRNRQTDAALNGPERDNVDQAGLETMAR
ncbi:Porphobilinogen deaminase [Taphrina deformans PYCC 5710]|uniref:Porphobilinogen deaminase n=1 Tax=Taphrina deformans (strain PYCC 5710 / ATCC 11124 / CBS 356.35 / IMI 108563 / JCM 9778 / NBRC 8474) TaxID=1097556 RepID=R4X9I8_TAPDE|nr:Porphobilinogen deaminase [Taphrina deformans PYCC 5710]|eukprot:CCG82385.1 Porphobilinogen deaminase [Taphrina deformans PYCC 5710]